MIVLWVAVVGVGWLLWKLLKHLILPSPLDIVPGPPSGSVLRGTNLYFNVLSLSLNETGATGNIEKIHARNPWEFLDRLTNDYAPIIKMTGVLGVCDFFFWPSETGDLLVHTSFLEEIPHRV